MSASETPMLDHDDEIYDDEPEVVYTTHPKVVAGVVVLASLALFGAVSGMAFIILDSAYGAESTRSSAIMSMIIGAALSALFWVFVPDDAP